MGGRTQETKAAQRQLNTEGTRINNDYNGWSSQQQGNLFDASSRASSLYDETLGNYRNFLDRDTSGFGIGSEARSGFSRYSKGGGVTPENEARLRGGGVYDEYARTGGLSENDKGVYRSRGTASIPSFYGNLRNEMSTARAAQGGYSPGYDAQTAKSVRDQAGAYQDAATNVEGDILDRVDSGRRFGAEGMSRSEGALIDARQRGEMFGIGGLADSDKFDSSMNLANQGMNLNAIQGMGSMRGQVPGEVQMYLQALLEGMGQRNSATGQNVGQNLAFNPNSSWWDRWGKDAAGMLASVAGTYASGGMSKVGQRAGGY